MKVAEIEIGEEYAYTGPLAYGVEPHVLRPEKIRFVDLTPGWGRGRIMEACAVEPPRSKVTGAKARQSWKHVATQIVNPNKPKFAEWRDLPVSTHTFPILAEGTQRMIFKAERGHFLAERWNGHAKEWEVALFRPAGVHRTWAEHVENERKAKAQARQRDLDAAPSRYAEAIHALVKNARMQGFEPDRIVHDIYTEWGVTRP